MSDDPVTNKSSGPLAGLYQSTLGSSVAAATIGVVYGCLLAWTPYLNALTPLAAIGFAYLVARVAELLLDALRVPSRGARLWVPVVAGTLGYYVAWVAWIATIYYNRDAFVLVWDPISVARHIWWMTGSPTWQILGWWPQWPDLGSMWLCEVITFFAALHASADGVVKRYDARMEREAAGGPDG